MSSAFVFEGLKMHLKARGMTYADVARGLRISEPTVKRIFAQRNCDLKRLQALCEFIQVDLAELARGLPRQDRLIHRMTHVQEEELMADPRLFIVAVCAIHQMRVEEITALYDIEPAECVALLLRLEKIGILELHENNRIRLRLARTFAWIPDGPIMQYAKSQCTDFFNYSFSGAGQLMRMITVRITREAPGRGGSRVQRPARRGRAPAARRAPPDQHPARCAALGARDLQGAAPQKIGTVPIS
jgi:transcriptional regulator with XRE-family HTH domain